jgi:hypothetical protein
VLLVLALCPVLPALAQTTSGVISGVAADSQGGVLPGVAVTVRNTETGAVRSAVTEADGRFRIAGLSPGRYDLKAEISGFAPIELKDMALTVGLEISRNLTMALSGVQESLTVTAQAPVVETTKTDVSGTITQKQIETLPLDTRQPIGLALLLPGTSQDAVRPRKFSANLGAGAYTNAGALLVDGVWNKEGNTGEPRQDFPQVAIREFKVNISQASAEYGWTASGVITFVTKSGSNMVTGEVFEYLRDKSLNTLNKFEELNQQTKGTPKPDFRRHQFGGGLGGPIVKDRLHFFGAVERTKINRFTLVNTGKPDLYGSLEGSFAVPEYNNNLFGRLDAQINPQQSAFLRYAYQVSDFTCDTCGGTNAWFSASGIRQLRNTWAGGHTWVVSPKALNELRFQWAEYNYREHPPGVDPQSDLYDNSSARLSALTQVYQFPSLVWGTNNNFYTTQLGRQIRDDFSLSLNGKGSHNVKFGGGVTNLHNFHDLRPALGSWTFASDQPFDPINAASIAALKNPILFTAATPAIKRDLPNLYLETYVQDEWRPRSNLTVNIGLRWDAQAKVFNTDMDLNDKTMFPTTGTSQQIPYVDFAKRGDWNNIGPRVALAWDVRSDGKSVVRLGYGLYFNPIFTVNVQGEQTNYRQAAITISNPTYPDPYGGKDPLTYASTAPQVINILANDLENPESRAYTAGFSQSITPTLGIHADLVYNKMSKVTLIADINPRANGATGARPLPAFARIDQSQSIGTMTYQALLLRLEKRFEKRTQFLISYTLAKGEGTVPSIGILGRITDVANPGQDFGPASNDRRHVIVASGAVLLPGDVTLGGVWTYRSTMPFSAIAGRDLNGDGQVTDYVAGTTRAMSQTNLTGMLAALNVWRAANGRAAIPESQIDSNRYNSFDLRVSKAFPIGGRRRLEVIGQVFNIFGVDNLLASGGAGGTGVAASWTQNALSDSYGRILQASNRQQAEVAVRFVF